MARLDHYALRVMDRHKTAKFFVDALGYKIATEFDVDFEDGEEVKCFVLTPSEKTNEKLPFAQKLDVVVGRKMIIDSVSPYAHGFTGIPEEDEREVWVDVYEEAEYHLAPEVFISSGTPNSIVGRWVEENGSRIHHLAYMVDDVESEYKVWQEKGYCEFSSEPIKCPGLTQIFSKPSELTGFVIELIKREKDGFCKDSVKQLMLSSDAKHE